MNLTFLSIWEHSSHPNLGILYLSSYLKKYLGAQINITYLDQEKFLIDEVIATHPDVIALTAVTPNFSAICSAAKQLKERLDVTLLLGGPHITSLPTSLPDCVDIGIIGEGEETLVELFNKNFKNLNKINGIVYGKNKTITPKRDLIDPLDKIPFPDRGLLPKRYFEPHDILTCHRRQIGTSINTSRGCPYSCVYCLSKVLWPRARFFSARYVADEIIMLREKYNVKAIAIDDDLFIFKQDRIKEIIDYLDDAGLLGEIQFNCTARANMVNDELMQLLKRMGVVQINLGVESGSERILKYLKKGTVTVEQNQIAVDLAHKYGIQTYCNFMLGAPSETKEDMLKTFNFYKRNKIETATLNIVTPLPGTELWSWSKERGLVSDEMNWDTFFNSLYKPETQLYINEIVPHNEFIKIYKEFQQEIFKRAALSWQGLSFMDAFKCAIKQPKKSILFLFKNYRKIPGLLNKKV